MVAQFLVQPCTIENNLVVMEIAQQIQMVMRRLGSILVRLVVLESMVLIKTIAILEMEWMNSRFEFHHSLVNLRLACEPLFLCIVFAEKKLEKCGEIDTIMNMIRPRFPYNLDWVKLMADYLQQEISSDHPERYGANDLLIPVIFLAWAPGAGKTEWIESFPDLDNYIVLDSDLYRSLFDGYIGSNAAEFYQFASRVMDRMYSHCIKHGYNMIVDGTFANSQKASENIRQCEKKWLEFSIVLVTQDPIISYLYTKKREQEKLRNVPTEVFIDKFYRSIEVVWSIFSIYSQARVYLATKVSAWKFLFVRMEDREDFDKNTTFSYNRDQLTEYIQRLSTDISANPAIIPIHLWHLHKKNSNISNDQDS
jgi:predicted ABC-type ATPase